MKRKILATIVAAGTVLSGCSGGGAGAVGSSNVAGEASSATAVAGYLSGTAAVGAPLGLATVNVKNAGGACATGKTNSIGVFSVDAGPCGAGPYLIKVSSTIGEVSTLASEAGEIINVTPLTQLISQRATRNKDLSVVDLGGVTSTVLKVNMTAKQTEVKAFLKEYAKAVGAVTDLNSVDLMGGSFAANGTGVDKLLDLIKINDGTNADSIVSVTVAGNVTPIAFDIDDNNAAPAIDEAQANAYKEVAEEKAEQMDEVRAFARDLTAIFKNGAPTQTAFDKFVGVGFKHNGYDSTKMLGEFTEDRDIAGIQIRNAVIINDAPSNFWVAFQIFGIENGKYALWSTWTSKVENPLTAPKLLGNGLGFSLEPAFVKVTTINASKVSSPAPSVRALRIGGADASVSPSFMIKELNEVAITNGIKVTSGILDHNHTNYTVRNILGLASEYIKINTNEALTPIVKIKYDITGGASDQESYIVMNQVGQEQQLYMDLEMPDYDLTAVKNCTWNIDDLIAAPVSKYNITNQNGEFGYANIYLENPADDPSGFLRASAYDPDLLLAAFTDQVEDYVTANTVSTVPPETIRMKAAVLHQYGVNDFIFSHVYKCD